MPVGESFVVTDLLLYLQVLCSVEIPIGILPAAVDSLVQDIAILFLHSVFAPVVPLVLGTLQAWYAGRVLQQYIRHFQFLIRAFHSCGYYSTYQMNKRGTYQKCERNILKQ